jgi:DNA-binding NarL/FixJ family response regulator
MHKKRSHQSTANLPPTKVRILVADDFDGWRVKVREILGARPDWQIIFETCDGFEAVQKTLELRPDVVLLDLAMIGLNGIEAAERILKYAPDSRIIFLTQNPDTEIRNAALATGAKGYVLKFESAKTLMLAISAALGEVSE